MLYFKGGQIDEIGESHFGRRLNASVSFNKIIFSLSDGFLFLFSQLQWAGALNRVFFL